MTVTTIDKDTEALTLTLVADFAAPVDAVWELWADPRKLERWWGPPTYPATFVEHDLTPGALVTYFMTSPEGDELYGWWRIGTVDAPRGLTIEDGFGDADGKPLTDKTGQLRMRLFEHDGGTRMELRDQFPSARADGGGAEDGHGGGPASGRRADGRSALVDVDVAGSATGPGGDRCWPVRCGLGRCRRSRTRGARRRRAPGS